MPATPDRPPQYNNRGLPTKPTLAHWEETGEGRAYPPMPEDFTGTEPEWAINWALTKLNCQFDYQHNLAGGRKMIGGIVADFAVYVPVMLLIQVQGSYWHYELGTEKQEADALQRAIIGGMGWHLINIDEDDANRAPMFYTQEALLFIDHSKSRSGA